MQKKIFLKVEMYNGKHFYKCKDNQQLRVKICIHITINRD